MRPGGRQVNGRLDHEIRQRLDASRAGDLAPGVRYAVARGWVTLEGVVQQEDDSVRAQAWVCRCEGVRGVTNKIEVHAGSRARLGDEVRRAITEALVTRARQRAGRIGVAVSGTRVTLSGRVTSWLTRETVVAAARRAPGVGAVEDCLHVDPER